MCVSNTICENKVIIKVKPKHVILFFQLMRISGVKQGSIFDVTFPNSSKQFTAMYHGPKIKFLNPFPQLWHHERKMGQRRPEFAHYVHCSDRKIKSCNHTIFEKNKW